jgi:hypothetical protein
VQPVQGDTGPPPPGDQDPLPLRRLDRQQRVQPRRHPFQIRDSGQFGPPAAVGQPHPPDVPVVPAPPDQVRHRELLDRRHRRPELRHHLEQRNAQRRSHPSAISCA